MEPNIRDTPLRRFTTFWWGAALFLGVGILALVLRPMFADKPAVLEDAYYDGGVRDELTTAKEKQEAALEALNIEEAMEAKAKELKGSAR